MAILRLRNAHLLLTMEEVRMIVLIHHGRTWFEAVIYILVEHGCILLIY